MKRFLLSLLLFLLTAPAVLSQQSATIDTDVMLYSAPGAEMPQIMVLDAETSVLIEGRDITGHWLLVSTPERIQGWVSTGQIQVLQDNADEAMLFDLLALPVLDNPVLVESGLPQYPAMAEATTDPDLLLKMQALYEAPIFINMQGDTLDEIFLDGQSQGKRAAMFTRVGDSDTTTGGFLRPIGIRNGHFCEYGNYAYLQETIDYFMATPVRVSNNAFDASSRAAVNGLSAASALDSLWRDTDYCAPNETPLDCEYRIREPAVAVVMLGRMDTGYYDEAFYREAMSLVIERSIEQGVIPILTTFVVLPGDDDFVNSIIFNAALLEIAEDYDVPLINLWKAVQTLPQYGIGPDLTHLSYRTGFFCDFAGAEREFGGTMRNLLTLQALDFIRRSTLQPNVSNRDESSDE